MNYIELINFFWQMRRRVRLSSSEADLYYFLMQESNIRHWENPFECSNGIICASIGFSESTLITARNGLKKKGLVRFKPGQRKAKSPVYTLLYPKNESITNTITESIYEDVTPNPPQTKAVAPQTKSVASRAFAPPAIEEVTAYCTERKNDVDARKFIDFYTAKNWMIGRNKMKDWQAAIRTWEKSGAYQHPAADYKPQKTISDERF